MLSSEGVRDILRLRRGLRIFGATQPLGRREQVSRLLRALSPREHRRRREALQRLPVVADEIEISEEAGCLLLDSEKLPVMAAVDEARGLMDRLGLRESSDAQVDRPFASASIGEHLAPDSPILKLALDRRIVAGVSRYLGMVPIFEDMILMYSPNRQQLERSSQFYHLDGQDTRTIQIFIHLNDIGPDSGPLTLLPAAATEKIANQITYRKVGATKRIDDSIVDRSPFGDQVQVVTGPAGTACLIDADRCFHFGSRAGGQPRMTLVIQYYTPFAFAFDKAKRAHNPFQHLLASDAFDDIDRMVLRG
jgi:hypothetical protein